MALTIPALLADRVGAHGGETVLRKKHRGIWQAVTWTELGSHVRKVAGGLLAAGFRDSDVACMIGETRPELAYIDLGILSAGGVSGAIDPESDAEPLGETLRQAQCRMLFVENEEQLDKALTVRDRCPALQRIIVVDMKGLRDFADPKCVSLREFLAGASDAAAPAVAESQPAVLLSSGQVLTHAQVLAMVAHARSVLDPQARGERVALLPMCQAMERILGLYLSLDVRAVSNYLESPETVVANLQEVQPTMLGTDAALWQRLYARTTATADGATRLQRGLYRWAIATGGPIARLCVLNAVRRELGLHRLRRAYIGSTVLPPEVERWTASLGITLQRINGQATQGIAMDGQHRALLEAAYGS